MKFSQPISQGLQTDQYLEEGFPLVTSRTSQNVYAQTQKQTRTIEINDTFIVNGSKQIKLSGLAHRIMNDSSSPLKTSLFSPTKPSILAIRSLRSKIAMLTKLGKGFDELKDTQIQMVRHLFRLDNINIPIWFSEKTKPSCYLFQILDDEYYYIREPTQVQQFRGYLVKHRSRQLINMQSSIIPVSSIANRKQLMARSSFSFRKQVSPLGNRIISNKHRQGCFSARKQDRSQKCSKDQLVKINANSPLQQLIRTPRSKSQRSSSVHFNVQQLSVPKNTRKVLEKQTPSQSLKKLKSLSSADLLKPAISRQIERKKAFSVKTRLYQRLSMADTRRYQQNLRKKAKRQQIGKNKMELVDAVKKKQLMVQQKGRFSELEEALRSAIIRKKDLN